MANIHDVARAAGVSVATVSHVINDSRFVSPETRKKVLAAVAELNYRRDGIARSLRRNKTGTIGVMISDITNPYFSDLVRGIEDAIHGRQDDHNFILCNTEENAAKELLYLNVLLEKRVDGLIIAPAGGNHEEFRKILAAGLPLVFVDRILDDVGADGVGVNNRVAARKAVSHLIKLGHRRIALMKARLDADSILERIAGYHEALSAAGIAYDSALELDSASTIEQAHAVGRQLMSAKPRPDAVFCTNNFMTLGVMQAITEAGFDCPKDIALVGFDDFPWATAFRPRLTVLSQPSYAIGREAVSLLFDRITKRRQGAPVRIIMEAPLIVRDSCGSSSPLASRAPNEVPKP